jgi:peptidyl-prolyl cis-trans isomerase SurA
MRKLIVTRAAGGSVGFLIQACLVAAMLLAVPLGARPVYAQTIVASINGDPITSIDIEQRMKMLRVLHKAATRDAAIESLFTERLQIHEAEKYGVNPRDSDISEQIVKDAQQMKTQPEALVAELQRAGVSQDHFKAYFRAELAFNLLVQALNKGVEASETQVREELAKEGGKAAAGTSYTVQQVIFAIPSGASPAALNALAHKAEELRARFTDCATGLPMAREMNDVTVRDPLTRTSRELGDALRELLDKTPIGHLTPPQRSSQGLEMVAVCSRGPAKDDTAVRQAIAQKLLAAHIAEDGARRLKELRERAVVVKGR